MIGLAVVGDENIRPAIAVEVRAQDSKPRPDREAEPRRLRSILKPQPRPLAIATTIAIQAGDRTLKVRRMAIVAAVATAPAREVRVKCHVVDDDEIEPAVSVVVEKTYRRAP